MNAAKNQLQNLQQTSLFIEQGHHRLHLRHIFSDAFDADKRTPVLMIHGAIENGLIFYTHKGKGLACYLAQQGFDVYVADLRGRGESKPSIKEDPNHGQYHSIVEDIPKLIEFVAQQTQQKMHLVCHSWGGGFGVKFFSQAARFIAPYSLHGLFWYKTTSDCLEFGAFIQSRFFLASSGAMAHEKIRIFRRR